MKYKYLTTLLIISLSTSVSSWGQEVADVPAATKINLKAELTEAKPAKELFDKMAEMITEEAKKEGANINGKVMLEAFGLDTITSYAMSSEKEGTDWKNLMFLHNKGSDKGIFPILGKKGAEFSAPSMCPAGSDLVIQMDLDLRTVEGLIRNIIKASNTSDGDQQDFEDTMKEEIPKLGMNTSAMLGKLNARVNIAIDLDDKVKIALPMVGELDKPRLIIRLDGVTWIWDKIGDEMIAQTGMPLDKKEVDGVTTYKLPPQMAAQFMGYLPALTVDKNKDQIWISSSPAFLKRSMSGEESLARSTAFKETMKGLSEKGNAIAYMSKDFADLLIKLHGIAQANGMMQGLGDATDDIDKMLAELKLIKQGTVSTLTRTDDGILYTERGVRNYKERIKEFEEAIQELKNF